MQQKKKLTTKEILLRILAGAIIFIVAWGMISMLIMASEIGRNYAG